MIKAVFFDLDDTLVDAMSCHEAANRKAFLHFKMDYDEAEKRTQIHDFMGTIIKDILRIMRDSIGVSEETVPLQILSEVRETYFLEEFEKSGALMPGAESSVKTADTLVQIVGIVSSGTTAYIQTAVKKFSLNSYIDFIVGAEDVTRGKPNPDCYLKAFETASRQSSLKKEECLVVEDAVNGVKAAAGAGLRVCYVPYTATQIKLDTEFHLSSLEQFPELLKSII